MKDEVMELAKRIDPKKSDNNRHIQEELEKSLPNTRKDEN